MLWNHQGGISCVCQPAGPQGTLPAISLGSGNTRSLAFKVFSSWPLESKLRAEHM